MTPIPPGAKRLSPGFYSHGGAMHVDFEEYVAAAGGDPTDPTDRATAEKAIEKILGEAGIPLEVREK